MSKIFEALQRSKLGELPGSKVEEILYANEYLEPERSKIDDLSIPTDFVGAEHEQQCEPQLATEILRPTFAAWPRSVTPPEAAQHPSQEASSVRHLIPSLPAGTRLVSISEPTSLAAEKFRVLSVRLRNMASTRELKRILITSALPEEGKSVCSINLSAALARNKQRKTLLIEGDLRRPSICRNLGIKANPGLTEWFRGEVEMKEVICRVDPPGFWLIPAGLATDNPLELMQAAKLSELFAKHLNGFDWIILDSTPVTPLADTALWSRYVDGVLLVIREGKTAKEALRKALGVITPSSLLGAILNDSSSNGHRAYYTYCANTSTELEGRNQS